MPGWLPGRQGEEFAAGRHGEAAAPGEEEGAEGLVGGGGGAQHPHRQGHLALQPAALPLAGQPQPPEEGCGGGGGGGGLLGTEGVVPLGAAGGVGAPREGGGGGGQAPHPRGGEGGQLVRGEDHLGDNHLSGTAATKSGVIETIIRLTSRLVEPLLPTAFVCHFQVITLVV